MLAGSVLLFALVGPPPVSAQTPPDGGEVVQLMHDRYVAKWYTTLTFTQATTRRTPADTMVHETWYEAMKLPGKLRIDVGAPDGDPIILFNRDSIFVRRGGKALAPRAGLNPLLLLGFDVYTQPIERTVSALRDEGFDLSKMHEDTWQGHKVFVVGASVGDSTSKQFWVDADRLLFVRMLGPAGPGDAGREDVRFDRYQPAGGGWLATLVTDTRDGALVQREEYSDIRVNVQVSDSRFNPALLSQP
jgi:outer membrane lipoprotein-sorting protein